MLLFRRGGPARAQQKLQLLKANARRRTTRNLNIGEKANFQALEIAARRLPQLVRDRLQR